MQNFIFGLVFALAIMPILDGLTSLILSFFEMIKGYFGFKIAESNQKIQNLSTEPSQRKIGFDLPGEEVEDE